MTRLLLPLTAAAACAQDGIILGPENGTFQIDIRPSIEAVLWSGDTPAPALLGYDDDAFFAGKATLTWTPADEQLYYLSIAQAIKPSGVSTTSAGISGLDPTPGEDLPGDEDFYRFKQEKMLVYELGAKTR